MLAISIVEAWVVLIRMILMLRMMIVVVMIRRNLDSLLWLHIMKLLFLAAAAATSWIIMLRLNKCWRKPIARHAARLMVGVLHQGHHRLMNIHGTIVRKILRTLLRMLVILAEIMMAALEAFLGCWPFWLYYLDFIIILRILITTALLSYRL